MSWYGRKHRVFTYLWLAYERRMCLEKLVVVNAYSIALHGKYQHV